jgi:hypothetical protein
MEVPELTFQLNVQCYCELDELASWFKNEWIDLNIEWRSSGRVGTTEDNWIEFGKSPHYDPNLIHNEDGWFHYRYHILVASRLQLPLTTSDLHRQIEFAHLLKQRLTEKGCLVKVNADFENMV